MEHSLRSSSASVGPPQILVDFVEPDRDEWGCEGGVSVSLSSGGKVKEKTKERDYLTDDETGTENYPKITVVMCVHR